MDALEGRHVDHAGAVADERHARRPQLLGCAQYPPEGIVFAPQPTRLPPSMILATIGCDFSSWKASCTEKRASR